MYCDKKSYSRHKKTKGNRKLPLQQDAIIHTPLLKTFLATRVGSVDKC